MTGVNVFLTRNPRHPKIGYFTFRLLTNENISRCQVTMAYLKDKNSPY